MTLLATKKAFKKIWVWVKHNWYVPAVIIYTLFLWIVLRKRNEAEAVLAIRDSSYKAQIETINKVHKEEIQKRDEILKKYTVIIKELEEKFKENQEKLDKQKKNEVKKIIKEYHNDPDGLAKMLAEKYGLEYTGDQ
tara:strand:+ start:300 stop:707 length:408 start_codon:yes stop_codon:yes gene_type:complete